MEFRILGPLQVTDRGHPVVLGGAKQRTVLALLLLDANQVVSVDRLVDGVWGEHPPARAASTLQVYVANLRKVLEPDRAPGTPASVLRTQAPGYLLDLAPRQLDLARFEALAVEGRKALAAGRAAPASVLLREALTLWRGRPLEDLPADVLGPGEPARLEELRAGVIEDRVEADLASGRHAEVIGELEALVARHPFRERLVGQWMLALYRCGRQADALAAYRDARDALVEELGVEPGPELRALEAAVLDQDAALAAPPVVPLDRDDVARLLGAATGTSPDAATVASIYADTGGNSYAVEEAVRHEVTRVATHRLAGSLHDASTTSAGLDRATQTAAEYVLAVQRSRRADALPAVVRGPDPEGTPPAPVACPYKGLARFEPEDAVWFHGRERLTAELLARLAVHHFIGVVGASGSGKSSLVRAGLLAALREGALPGSEGWPCAVLAPGRDPIDELARALASTCGLPSAAVRSRLEAGVPAFAALLQEAAAAGADNARFVLLVDQFEELFTVCRDADERALFIELLTGAVAGADSPLCVVLAVRADYYGRCAEYTDLAALLTGSVLVGAMEHDELRRAIEEPARIAGIVLEPGLVERVFLDVGDEPGSLPLLATALVGTWERRRGVTLSAAGYEQAGGVRGALARLAEDSYERLDVDQKRIARDVFVRLAEPGQGTDDVRRRAPLDELLVDDAHTEVLATLVESRLVVTGERTAEVAHEALLREWPRLRDWLESDREGRRARRALAITALEWEQAARDDDLLYRGTRLAAAVDASDAAPDDTNPLEREFLAACRARQDRDLIRTRRNTRRLQRALAAALVAVLIASVAGVVALHQRNRANGAARRAATATGDAELGRLVAESRALVSSNQQLALLLAVESYRSTPDTTTRDALLGAVFQEPRLQRSFGPTAGVTDIGGLTGARVAVAADRANGPGHGYELSVWNWKTGQPQAWPAAPLAAASRACSGAIGLATSAQGDRIAVVTADGLLHLFSGQTLEPQGEPEKTGLDHFSACDAPIAFSPDGRWLAVANGAPILNDTFTGDTVVLFQHTRDGWSTGPALTGHQIRVDALAFSKDNEHLATSSPAGKDAKADPGVIVLHDVRTGNTSEIIDTHADNPLSIALDWDRGWVVASTLLLPGQSVYHLDKRVAQTTAGVLGAITGPFYNADWTRLAAFGKFGLELFDADRLEPIKGFNIDPKTGGGPVIYLPDDQILLAGSRGPMTVWDLRSPPTSVLERVNPKLASLFPTARPDVFITSKSTSGGVFVTIRGPGPDYRPLHAEIRIGAPTPVPLPPGVCADPHTNRIATVGTGSRADKGDIVVRQGVPPFDPMSGTRGVVEFAPVKCVWRPDGRQIAIGGINGEVALYQVATRELRRVKAGLHHLALSLTYRPDSKELWVASPGPADLPARITNLDNTPHATRALPALGAISAVHFTSDGRFLVTADETNVQVLDAHSLEPVTDPIAVTKGFLLSLSVSPDGQTAVTSGLGGLMQLVDLRAGRVIGPPIPIAAPGVAKPGIASFGRDNSTIYPNSADGKATVWDLAPDLVRDAACALAGRNLTEAEWHGYLSWAGPRRKTCPQFP